MEESTAETKPADAKTEDAGGSNIKETIESILIAFILAFIFRAFVLEAFVIPTGSMAPTLLGAHMRFRCPDCGYQFDVNVSGTQTSDPDDINIPPYAMPPADIYCPNCGEKVASPQDAAVQAVHYGDRILVLKYAYLIHPPKRWDVVVFKSPAQPDTTHYSQNYIKRLVGLPGEQLMVLDGNLYVYDKSNAKWEIQTRPYNVQEALWRIVYNNDFYPQQTTNRNGPDFTQPWASDSGAGWTLNDAANPRIFHFQNNDGAGAIRFNPAANKTAQNFSEYLVYDTPHGFDFDTVSDLKLVAYYQRAAGQGALRLNLSRYESQDHTFTASITADKASLTHVTNLGVTEIGAVNLADYGISPNSPILIEFSNVDYRVSLRLNGKEVLASSQKDYAPNVPWLLSHPGPARRGPEVSIDAEKQSCTVTHLSLWRDIYYTNRRHASEGQAPVNAMPSNPLTLNDGEYFVMGDNSMVSSDARFWTDKINLPHEGLSIGYGRVPAQFLLGKAVYVYWPAGYRPFDPKGYAVIPNFGSMRWIH